MASLTIGSVIERVRDQINEQSLATGYWLDKALFNYCYDAQTELALDCDVIQDRTTFVTTTTGTREYSLPTNTLRIQHITYDSRKIQQIDQREFMRATNNDGVSSTVEGTPLYYYVYGTAGGSGFIGMEPKPDKAAAVVMWRSKLPPTGPGSYTSSTEIEVPYEYGHFIQEYVLWKAWSKEHSSEGVANARFHRQMWMESVERVKRMQREKNTGDRYKVVKDSDNFFNTGFGII